MQQTVEVNKEDMELLLNVATRPSLTHLNDDINRIRQSIQISDQILTAQEVADLLKVNVRTVQNLLQAGKIRGVKVGRAWRINKAELFRFINGNSDRPSHPGA